MKTKRTMLWVDPFEGSAVTFTAPSNAMTALVRVNVRDVHVDKYFTVVAPSGIDHAIADGGYIYQVDQSGAGMHLIPYVGPTTVSFYRIQCFEVGEDATDIGGYFANFPDAAFMLGHHSDQGAEVWFPINEDNSWFGGDKAMSAAYSPWSPGGWMGGERFLGKYPENGELLGIARRSMGFIFRMRILVWMPQEQ